VLDSSFNQLIFLLGSLIGASIVVSVLIVVLLLPEFISERKKKNSNEKP